ncbi:ubinuclein-1-like [Aristolochia californica]|uniref:ubinuclein-1-like n=1 Tax=Aristolochia californica TaxID=171875 RepID=UPI0035E12C8F
MEDEMSASRVSNPNPPPLPSIVPGTINQRQRFTVELRPGETTIVSWKKLIRDSNKANLPPISTEAPSGARPSLESRIAPRATNQSAENEGKDEPPSNRFSAVIEKIERLYMGQHSSDDEELDKVPDDDEYDTEDSFIDDAELDEYFEVDKAETKHSGFFVNRGKLERINKPTASDNQEPKKRRRKDVKSRGEDGEQLPTKHVKAGNVRMKAAARNAALAASKSSGPPISVTPSSEHYQESKSLQTQSNAHEGPNQKKTAESPTKYEHSSLKMMNRDASLYPMEAKEVKRQKSGIMQPREGASRSKKHSEYSDAISMETHSRKFLNDSNGTEISTKVRHREKNGSNDLPDSNSSGSKYSMNLMKSSSMAGKESSSVRPKGTMLERAIRDLEKIVAESRPPAIPVQEVDAASQGIKKRLPQEIKQKLAKVARLAQSSQGRISDELINHLMGILGHLVQLKTLKRHLKEMVELGLSAKQHKADMFQQVKKEVIEMIRARNTTVRSKAAVQQDGSSEDFQEVHGSEEKAALLARYRMDEAMEDKIFYLYELYVEGMDEDRGPQSRKLYVELAELWPHGSIDSNGIKIAVNRARERKKQLYMQHKNAEKIKRKRVSSTVKLEATVRGENSMNALPRVIQDSGVQVFASTERPISSPMRTNQFLSSSKPSILALHASYAEGPRPEKVRGSAITSADELIKITEGGVVKKKVKRKPESDFVEVHGHHSKLSSQHRDKERQRSHKQHSATLHQKQSLPSTGIPGCEQPS